MQDHFHLLHRSVRHAPTNLKSTIDALCSLLQEGGAHAINEARQARRIIDHLREGMRILQTGIDTQGEVTNEANDGAGDTVQIEAEDISLFDAIDI